MFIDNMYMQDFYYKGTNNKLIFFIHGIYSCPAQFNMFYPILKDKGYSIYATLLEGHGNELRKLSKVKYNDWMKQINDLLEKMSNEYQEIYVIGHSMGGLLALDTDDIYLSKRVLIAPALRVKLSWRYIKMGLVVDNLKVKDEYTVSNRRVIGVFFPKQLLKRLLAVFCFWQLFKLMYYTDINLFNIKKPILIIQSRSDECVSTNAPKRIMNHIGSSERRMIWLKKSFHGVFEKSEEKMMVNQVLEFLERGNQNESND